MELISKEIKSKEIKSKRKMSLNKNPPYEFLDCKTKREVSRISLCFDKFKSLYDLRLYLFLLFYCVYSP